MYTKNGTVIFLVFFCLPFTCIGIATSYLLVSTITNWQEAKNWVPTKATIEHLNLESYLVDESDSGKSSTHYKVTGRYSYTFNGDEFKSTQISHGSFGDSFKSYHNELNQKLNGKKTVTCLVNPEEPTEAILDNTLRFEIITFYSVFSICFGGVGIGLGLFFSTQFFREEKISKIGSETFQTSSSYFKALLYSTILTTIPLILSYLIYDEVSKQILIGRSTAYLGLIIPGLALILLIVTLYIFIRYLSFGKSTIVIEKGFGTLGGKLEAYIITKCAPKKGFDICLYHGHRTMQGMYYSKSESLLDSINVNNYELTSDGKVKTTFSFLIPYTSPSSEDRYITWKVDVKADVIGPDYHCSFYIPVKKTSESDKKLTPEKVLSQKSTLLRSEAIAQEKIKIHESENTLHIYFPMLKNIKSAIAMSLFLIGWYSITILLILKGSWFFAFLWGVTDILITSTFIRNLFLTKKLTVTRDGIIFKKGLWGGGREHYFPIEDIQDILIPFSDRPYRNYLKIKLKDKSIVIDESIKHISSASALKIAIEKIIYEN
ncbi:MAG: DUF3592 domain-containing protein [Lentisphaeraceae bacterium]|nr:DUF3592 domain-containing protein [Lentisphaeraceae bacterium]